MKRMSALLVLLVALVLAGCTPSERTVYLAHNQLRAEHGLAPLTWDEGAYDKARRWSSHMADQQLLSHSQVTEGIPRGWRVLGENVGVAESAEDAARDLANSPSHRRNILNPRYTRTAIGVIERDGVFWVTQIFLG